MIMKLLISIVLTVFSLSQNNRTELNLDGGEWKLQSVLEIEEQDGSKISRRSFEDYDWMDARVPYGVLANFIAAGECPDPMFSDNVYAVPQSLFDAPFWYRREFILPSSMVKDHVFLRLDGVSGGSQVWINGRMVGEVPDEGCSGKFDVTGVVRGRNAIAVRVKGGEDAGIWDSVSLISTGDVSIEFPYAKSTLNLPDTTRAKIEIGATIVNHSKKRQKVVLKGEFGWMPYNVTLNVAPGENRLFRTWVDMDNPRLWWPNGYGEQHLYDVSMRAFVGKNESDKVSFRSAVRQIDTLGGRLHVNGYPLLLKGGCIGLIEELHRFSDRDVDDMARLHREQNFNVIVNTAGELNGKCLASACDRYGLLLLDEVPGSAYVENTLNVYTFESLLRTLDEHVLWPVNEIWRMHGYDLDGKGFESAQQLGRDSQFSNYEEYRNVFESALSDGHDILLACSHTSTTTMQGGTYDYWGDPTASFFASRRACEPIHIQLKDSVLQVVNYSMRDSLCVRYGAQWFDAGGASLGEKVGGLCIGRLSVTDVCELGGQLDGAAFLKLGLYEGQTLLSENMYILGGELPAILPKAVLSVGGDIVQHRSEWVVEYNIENVGDVPALMLHCQVRDNAGNRVLPVFWSDNFISLMPGEKRTLRAKVYMADCPEFPQVSLEGYNL